MSNERNGLCLNRVAGYGLVLFCTVLLGASVLAAEGKVDPDKKNATQKKDPKDMNADEAEAAGLCPIKKNEHKLIYHAEYKEKKYHFCSRACQEAFKKAPEKFVKGVGEGTPAKDDNAKGDAKKDETGKDEKDAEKGEKGEKGKKDADMDGGDDRMDGDQSE